MAKTKGRKPLFGRVVTAMATPFIMKFGPFVVVNYRKARKLARHLIDSGSDAILVAGTTGESPLLTRRQEWKLFRAVIDEVGADKVVCGVGNNETFETGRFAAKVAKILRPLGLMLVTPYYNKPTQKGLFCHNKWIADAVYAVAPDVPIMLYNIWQRSVVNMEAETVLAIARACPNVRAIKEASQKFDQIKAIIEGAKELPQNFQVYSGNDGDTLEILALSGVGVVSVASHFVARDIQFMIANFFKCGATETPFHLRVLFDALFCCTSPQPLKYGLARVGLDMGIPMLPLIPLWIEGEEYCKQMDEALLDNGFELVDFKRPYIKFFDEVA